ncbi:MAG: Lrp/AsnC family transcriptional regulator, partial [Clostridia bacterium]|nr:Lrp/AsnC family transcriptional regulator [Clostridia bacterium]
MVNDILNILDHANTNLSNETIANMLGKDEKEVERIIKGLEKENIIVGYKTMINWEKTDRDLVTSIIELKVSPQRGEGFDKVAEKIYKYPQVKSLFLMSGSYD